MSKFLQIRNDLFSNTFLWLWKQYRFRIIQNINIDSDLVVLDAANAQLASYGIGQCKFLLQQLKKVWKFES